MNGSRLTSSAILVFALSTGTASAVANDRGVAVIVGNKHYADDRVPEVSYAHYDAEAFKRFVTGRLGFHSDNVIDLRDATKSQLETAFGVKGNAKGRVWQYIDREGGSSDVVVFYSGHGVPGEGGRGYLLPVDSNLDTAELNGYSIDLLYENLGGLPARSKTVFLDACFSGGSGSPSGRMLIRSASPVYVEADVSGGEGLTVLTAASGTQLASWDEEARHGLFTEHLLDGLYGAADADGDGRVTAREAKLHLDKTMTPAAARLFTGRVQNAGLHGDGSAVLSLARADGWGTRPSDRLHGCKWCPELAEIPAGKFRMGDLADEGDEDEKPVHFVQVQRFALARRETTVEQFRRFAEATNYRTDAERDGAKGCFTLEIAKRNKWDWTPGRSWLHVEYDGWKNDWPVVCVSWKDAQEYIGWLNKETDGGWRLPSEAEWEYAARAGSKGLYHFDDASRLHEYGNYNTGADTTKPQSGYSRLSSVENQGLSGVPDRGWAIGEFVYDQAAERRPAGAEQADGAVYPTSVGTYKQNAWGLHDMHGNVWEWVQDCWHKDYDGAPTDGSAWESSGCGPRRVLRGGSWYNSPSDLRAANRGTGKTVTTDFRALFVGFRVARTLAP